MRTLIGTSLATLLILLAARAEPRVYTRAQAPSDAALNRLGLKKAWQVHVPMEGKRDGIAFAEAVDNNVVIQTTSGMMIALDGETGKKRWEVRLGEPYRSARQEVATNERIFFVSAGTEMYGINRETGTREWTLRLPGVVSLAPIADLNTLYLYTGAGRVYGYAVPFVDPQTAPAAEVKPGPAAGAAPPMEEKPGEKKAGEFFTKTTAAGYPLTGTFARGIGLNEPQMVWSLGAEGAVSRAPVMTDTNVVFGSDIGDLYASPKDFRLPGKRLRIGSRFSTPLSHADDAVYFGTESFSVHAVDGTGGVPVLMWRMNIGDRIMGKPIPSGEDLFVVAANRGLLALNRFTDRPGGELRWPKPQIDPGTRRERWPNTDIDRFLAASKRFVFAADNSGHTVLLDRQTGQLLGKLETGEFAFHVTNETTGNIFLANHDGLVVCLRDVEELPIDLKTIDVVSRPGGGHDAVLTLQVPLPTRDTVPNALRLVFLKEEAARVPERVTDVEVSGGFTHRDEGNWSSSGGIIKEGGKEVGFVLDLAPRTDWPRLAPKRLRVPLDATTLLKGMSPTGKGRLMAGYVNRVGFSKRPLSNTISGVFDFNPPAGEAPK